MCLPSVPPIDPRKEAAILADLREGKVGIIKLAAAHGVGVGTAMLAFY